MGETDEVDYECMIKSFVLQGNALEQSEKQKLENYKSYEEILQSYQEIKKAVETLDIEKQISFGQLTEKLSIKNSLNRLQDVSNQKLQSVHEEILNLYETMTKESDDFNINCVNNAVNKIENLGSEFDESTILQIKTDCDKRIKFLLNAIKDKQRKYNELEKPQTENGYFQTVQNLQQILQQDASTGEIKEIESKIVEIDQQLLLHRKNIEFLKERNKELQNSLSS